MGNTCCEEQIYSTVLLKPDILLDLEGPIHRTAAE